MSMPVTSMIRRTRSSSGSPTCRTQVAQLVGEQREPLARLRRVVGRRPGRPARRSATGISVGSMPSAMREQLASPMSRVLDRDRAAAPAARGRGSPSSAQVARSDRPPRPGEQREQRGVGGRSCSSVQRRHDLGDLGQPEQPGQTDDLDRDAGAGQRVEDVRGVRVVAGQHADVGPRRSGSRRARRAPRSASQASSSACVSKTCGLDDARRRRPAWPRAGRPGRRTRRRAARRAGWRPPGSGASERRLTVSG